MSNHKVSSDANSFIRCLSRHNPFVDAVLERGFTKRELNKAITQRGDLFDGFDGSTVSDKEVALEKCFYIAPDYAFDVYSRLLTLMNMGYINRHPAEDDYDKFIHLKDLNDAPAPKSLKDSGSSIFVTGRSGVGKTQLYERLLEFMGGHVEHQPSAMTGNRKITQLMWVKLDMKMGDSRDAFYRNVIEKIDAQLQTNFVQSIPVGDVKDERFLYMIKICRMVCLGLLVIDDVQWAMAGSAANANKKVTNEFLESLFNQLGIPIVFIGTPEAKELKEFAEQTGRRLSHNGQIEIPLEAVNSVFWRDLVKTLFTNFLYSPPSRFKNDFYHIIHYYTQGNGDRLHSLVANLLRKNLNGDISYDDIYQAYRDEKKEFEYIKSPYEVGSQGQGKKLEVLGKKTPKTSALTSESTEDDVEYEDDFEDQFIIKGGSNEF